jgi:hypothetical protein
LQKASCLHETRVISKSTLAKKWKKDSAIDRDATGSLPSHLGFLEGVFVLPCVPKRYGKRRSVKNGGVVCVGNVRWPPSIGVIGSPEGPELKRAVLSVSRFSLSFDGTRKAIRNTTPKVPDPETGQGRGFLFARTA